MTLRKKKPSVVYWLPNANAEEYNLYLNITNQCSNNCYYCFRRYKNGVDGFNLKLHREPSPKEVIQQLQKILNRKNWNEIVFCGFGEPLERLNCILEATPWIRKHFANAIRIDTNGQGYLLNPGREVIKELTEAGVDKISVSLNAHNEETYIHVCKPNFKNTFENVLKFIEDAGKEFNTEVTTVTIPEVDIPKVREMARKMGVTFRIREYIPCFW
ncbi:MAG: radical SAM protein [Candidatus Bathyarchaeota archaeon]|nr:MAG: radical SAM protein [Candidatus Bathyarchaeota archaeon]